MYEFVDRPVTSLDAGSRLLVWSMRSWVVAVGQRKCPANTIAPVFAKRAVLPGLQPFLLMMALFNRHGRDNLGFCAIQCNHVSEHEALILTLLSTLQGRSPQNVKNTLALMVEEEAIGGLLTALSALRATMATAGMALHPPV